MKTTLLLFCFAAMLNSLQAQFSLQLVITEKATLKADKIFIAGNFNKWQPNNPEYKFKPADSGITLVLNLAAGMYEFKFTRGSWDKVETNAKGEDILNRYIEIKNDTLLNIVIDGWKDDYKTKTKLNTASANVHILDSAFYIPQLKRHRRIWIYLPQSYDQSKTKKYPVLYMHDGQNLFDAKTSAFGEWGLDECLDTLETKLNKECIVIGIDNSADKRLTEYNPYDNERFGKSEGKLYIEFIAHTLKPYIDKNYRTFKNAKHTYIAGSSMGGLISLYALIKYPDKFGAGGVFSPAFWVAPEIYANVAKTKIKKTSRIYFYAGQNESDSMVIDMNRMITILKQKKHCNTYEIVNPSGRHNEQYWRNEFDDFYKWLMMMNK